MNKQEEEQNLVSLALFVVVFFGGFLLAALFTEVTLWLFIPVALLFWPIVAVAYMVHWARRRYLHK